MAANTGGNVNTFDVYVEGRLDSWGREFRLGYVQEGEDAFMGPVYGNNILATLIQNKGEVRMGSTAREVSPNDWQMERIVSDIHRDYPHLAAVLRAYYCGRGRHAVERLELAEMLLGRPIGKRCYYAYRDTAFAHVSGILRGIAIAA